MLKQFLLVFTLAALIYTVIPAVAQDTGTQDTQNAEQPNRPAGPRGYGRSGFDPAMRAQMLTKRLNHDPSQQSKVQDILKNESSEMQKVRADSSLSPQDRHSKMMDIHKTSDEQIRALLNSDQQQKWDDMQKRREQRMEEHHGKAPGGASDSGQQPQ
jgi:hypothetical protein